MADGSSGTDFYEEFYYCIPKKQIAHKPNKDKRLTISSTKISASSRWIYLREGEKVRRAYSGGMQKMGRAEAQRRRGDGIIKSR